MTEEGTMRLFKTELYKLCHKKLFPAGIICILGFVLLYFFQNLIAETSTINGVEYHGYEAVRMDRQITEEFKGTLTDEKLRQIIDRYGFPQNVEPYYGLTDGNFLNEFVMNYASDGYVYDWNDYKIATKVLPIAESKLANAASFATGGIRLEYYAGWETFESMYHMEMILISILVLCVVSPIFSGESQTNMKPLLFTTQEGPGKDVHAKIAASLTVSAILWLSFSALDLLLYGMIYGWSGLQCTASFITGWVFSAFQILQQSSGTYLIMVMLLSLLGILELCGITLCISAYCRSSFHSVAVAAVCWIMPMFVFQFVLRGIYQILSSFLQIHELSHGLLYALSRVLFLFHCLLYSAPFYLICEGILTEISVINNRSEMGPLYIVIACACAVFALCIVRARKVYRGSTTIK